MLKIEPFHISVDPRVIKDVNSRLEQTRWPHESPEPGADGISVSEVKALADYWRRKYDWRKQVARLNEAPHFMTSIDGQRIHFIHVRSPRPDATPLLLTHGWPGSFVEFLDVIRPLSNPAAYGGDPADAFHVIVPSLPGFTFSSPLSSAGWTVRKISQTWRTLMEALGYARFGVHGGDWGAAISRDLGAIAPDQVLGVHLSYLVTPPSELPADATPLDRARLEKLQKYTAKQPGYWRAQATQPQALAYGLTDSPASQLAWIAQRFKDWTDSARPVGADTILTNVLMYWLTGTAGSSARIYFENDGTARPKEICSAPVGVCVFAHDIVQPIRSLAEKNLNIVRWTEFERGGHFAALEVPDDLVNDLRAFFRPLRG